MICPLCRKRLRKDYGPQKPSDPYKSDPEFYALAEHLCQTHKWAPHECGDWTCLCGATMFFYDDLALHLQGVGGLKYHFLMANIANI